MQKEEVERALEALQSKLDETRAIREKYARSKKQVSPTAIAALNRDEVAIVREINKLRIEHAQLMEAPAVEIQDPDELLDMVLAALDGLPDLLARQVSDHLLRRLGP